MTTPAVAAARFGMAAAVGAGLGLFYGFLRPLRRKSNWFADLIFVIATFFGWLYVGFGICRGDLRMAYFAGMALGGFGWEMTVGKLLRPVFFGFWQGIRKILAVIAFPVKKYLKFPAKSQKKYLQNAGNGLQWKRIYADTVGAEREEGSMAEQRKKRYRLVFIRTKPVVKLLILLAVVLSTVALVALRANIEEGKSRYEAMRQYAITVEGDNQDLDQRIKELGSLESALRIAMEELGLVLPDSLVITPGN